MSPPAHQPNGLFSKRSTQRALCTLLGLLSLTATPNLYAQTAPTPPSRTTITLRSSSHFVQDTYRATDHTSSPLRLFLHRLSLRTHTPLSSSSQHGPTLSTAVLFDLFTDFGLQPPTIDRQDSRQPSIATPNLLVGYARATDLFYGLVDVTLGRQLLLHPNGMTDLDGVHIALHTPATRTHTRFSLAAFAGQPVQKNISPLGLSNIQDLSVPTLDRPTRDTPTVTLGSTFTAFTPNLQASLGYQRTTLRNPPPTPLPSSDIRTEHLAATAQARTLKQSLTLRSEASYNLPLQRLDRALIDATTTLPSKPNHHTTRLGLSLHTWRPSFGLDSLWTIFDPKPLGGAILHATSNIPLPNNHALDLSTDVALRSFAPSSSDSLTLPFHPGSNGEHTTSTSTILTHTLRRPNTSTFQTLTSFASLTTETHPSSSWLLHARLGSRAAITPETSVYASAASITHQRTETSLQNGSFAAASLGTTVLFDNLGTLDARTEYRSSAAFLHALSLYLTYTIDTQLLD